MVITNLSNVSQNFFSPEIVERISNEIHQPVEKTKASLRSIIPTLLRGIVEKGSTTDGAVSLANMAQKQNIHSGLMINQMNPQQGNEIVYGIFGNSLSAVVSRLGLLTGLNTASIMKVLSMAAPPIIGVINLKIKAEKLTTYGLMKFLVQETVLTTGYETTRKEDKHLVIKKVGIFLLILLALMWWFGSRHGTVDAPTTNTTITMETL